MEAPPDPDRQLEPWLADRPRLRRWLYVLAGCLVLASLGLVAWLTIEAQTSKRLTAAEEAWLAAGGAPDLASAVPPKIPDAENAAIVLRKAGLLPKDGEPHSDARVAIDKIETFWSQHYEAETIAGLKEADRASLAELLKDPATQQAFETLSEAASKTGYYVDQDYSKGAELMIPHIGTTLNLIKAADLQCGLYLEQGEYQKAVELLSDMIRFARLLRNETLLVSALTAMACENIALNTVLTHSRDQGFLEACTPSFLALLRPVNWDETLRKTIDMEHIGFGLWGFKMVRTDPNAILGLVGGGSSKSLLNLMATTLAPLATPYWNYDQATYTESMAEIRSVIGSPIKDIRAVAKKQEAALHSRMVPTVLTAIVMPVLGNLLESFILYEVDAKLYALGMELNRYELEHGHYPENLEHFDADLCTDPLTGLPFHYRLTEEGFLLYSVGSDLIDGGGSQLPEDQVYDRQEQPDMVWTGRGYPEPEEKEDEEEEADLVAPQPLLNLPLKEEP